MPTTCAVCHSKASQCCSSCHTTYYCCKEHQKLHWKQHRNQCVSYKLIFSDVLGNHLVATRDIGQNEIILRETPLVLGPKVISLPLCLGCGQRVRNSYRCAGCGWPLCSSACESSHFHIEECKLMQENGYRATFSVTNGKKEAAYCAIVPIRVLLLGRSKPSTFQKIMKLMSHLEERRNTPLYKIFKTNVVDFCRDILGMKEYDEELILTIAGILDTNTFEIRVPEGDIKLRGLYPTAAMMAHDCKPNTKHFFSGESFTISVVAKVPIKKGEIISVTYTHTLWATLARRQHLKQVKCFDCSCARCADPTELGTYLGAIYCLKCKERGNNSYMVSSNPLDAEAVWNCKTCDHKIKGRQMTWGNEAIKKEVSQLEQRKGPKPMEDFLEKYSVTLHPTNWHVVEVKYALTQMYGNIPGYLLKELSNCQLERKISLCMEILEVMSLLDPGLSRARGQTLYELQAAQAIQTKRDFQNGRITKAAAKDALQRSVKLLQEAADILYWEPDMTKLLEEKIRNLAKEIEDHDC